MRLSRERLFRDQMPVTENYAYFDHAAVAPLPRPAAKAMIQYAQEASAQGDADWLSWASKVKALRTSAAELLNVSTNEVALVNSTTQGINLVAEGMPWESGDNVLIPENEFPSNMVPWRNLNRFGVEVRSIPVGADGRITADSFRPFLDQNTRLIALSWVGYSTGYRLDVGSIVEMAHKFQTPKGHVLVSLDAIQGLGAFPLDASETEVDFVCADGHKWMLGPEGAGVFYTKAEHLELLHPVGLGWNSLATAGFDPYAGSELRASLKTTAARYEGGTTNMSGMHGFGASLRLLLDSGLNLEDSKTAESILSNVASIEDSLLKLGFEPQVPEKDSERSGIIGVLWEEAKQDASQLAAARSFLLENGVVTSVRGGCLRISTHAYNNQDDIERLAQYLGDFRKMHKV